MRQINDFYKLVFLFGELEQAQNNPVFFRDCIIFTFSNNIVAEFNKSFLIKLLKNVHTYNFINNIDINKDKKYHIFQEFLQFLTFSELPLFMLNLKVKTVINSTQ